MVLACVIAGSHAYLVREGARRLDGDHRRAGVLDVRRALVRRLRAGDVPVDGRRRATSPSTRCSTSASSSCSARERARSPARSGSTERLRRWRPARFGAAVIFELVSRRHRRARPRSSSRTSPTRSATCFSSPRSSGSSRSPAGGPGTRWLLLGLGVLSTALADIVYLFQSAEGTYVEGTWIDILWPAALLLIAASAWVGDRTRAGLERRGPSAPRRPGRVRARRHRASSSTTTSPALNLLAIILSTVTLALVVVRLGADVPREPPPLRADAPGGDDRRPDRAREPPPAHRRSRRAARTPRPSPRRSSCSSTSTASRATTTRSDTRPATRCSRGSARSSRPCPGRDGAAYRLGGDEFCLLAAIEDGEAEPLIDRACAALTEQGEGFEIETSFGAIMLPDEATDASQALQVADERLYAQKYSRRGESDRTMAALLEALSIREPGAAGADRRGRLARRRRRPDARAAPRRARRARPRGAAPRSRQARRPGRDPLQARPARRARVGVRPAAHDRRRADPPRLARAAQRRDRRARLARELGRQRLSRRPRRRGDPARLAHHPRLQRLRRDDVAASVPRGDGASTRR